jgi:murein DD-endopeptidase MepM/ murein hydrolase activator NlpD
VRKLTILFLILFAFTHRVDAQTLTLKQAEIMLYPISHGAGTEAYFGGVKIPVFTYAGKDYALVPADVAKPIGGYNLRIKKDGKELEKKLIQVKAGDLKKTYMKRKYKFATLPKDKQESVTKDKAPLVAALNKASKEISPKLWDSVFRNPLDTIFVTSPFGYKRIYTNHSTTHLGVDLRAEIGTPVYAMSDGKVLWGEGKSLYLEGPMVAIDHGDGIVSKYLHLSKVVAQADSFVKAGDIIGYSGNEGADVSGAHLHLAIKVGSANVSPLQFIKEFQKLK